MIDSMAAIRVTFFQECEEQLADLESGLVAFAEGTADPDTLNAVFRSVHSIKGGAGAFQLTDLVTFAHGFETVLDEIRSTRLEPRPEIVRTMLHAADVLADLVRVARDGAPIGPGWRDVLADLDGIANPGSVSGTPADDPEQGDFVPIAIQIPLDGVDTWPCSPDEVRVLLQPRPTLFARGHDPLPVLRELALLGDVRPVCDLSRRRCCVTHERGGSRGGSACLSGRP
ncbi:Hpt domain-containing protein, partial [Rubellimicrobium roseum]